MFRLPHFLLLRVGNVKELVRSMTIAFFHSSEMSLTLWISLFLTYFPVAGSAQKDCLSLLPPSGVIWKETGKSASIQCNVGLQCQDGIPEVKWFVFYANSHLELNTLPGSRYATEAQTLTIHSLNPNDSGDYLCAVWKTIPFQVEFGTVNTLVVRGEVWHILLWLLFTLLAIYNLVLVIIIFRKKAGPHRILCIGKCVPPIKSSSATRLQFRSVVEELYNRRHLHSKADEGSREEPPSKASNDDIYQNV
ncbi:unnamed protein product [Lota lota]